MDGLGGGVGSGFELAKALVRGLRHSRGVQANYLVAVQREWANCAAVRARSRAYELNRGMQWHDEEQRRKAMDLKDDLSRRRWLGRE